MKIYILFILMFFSMRGISQQLVYICSEDNLYSVDINSCTSRLIGNTGNQFVDVACTPDGKLWAIHDGLWQIDTATAKISYVGVSKGTYGDCLVALNDSTLLGQWYDSLEAINVKTAQSTYIGKVGYTADGDISWLGNKLYLTGENSTYKGLVIKIEFNADYTAIVNSAPINNVNDPTPTIYGLATVLINGVQTLVAFANVTNGTAYAVSPIDGSLQVLCPSFPIANGAASISFPQLLPVQLLNFTAIPGNNTVNLQWQIVREINSNYFSVEKSIDGINFKEIGRVETSGNSSITQQYTFKDKDPFTINYYRLKEVDKDGKFTYSNILLVKVKGTIDFTIGQNPVQNNLQLQINKAGQLNQTSIFDIAGRRWKTFNVVNGMNILDVSILPSGIYIIKMMNFDGNVFQKMFIKEK